MQNDLQKTYNVIARDWHKDHAQDDWWIEGLEKFISLIPKGGEVLDAGCGSGNQSKYLWERGFQMTGFDISEKMIEIAKEQVPEASFHVFDFSKAETLKKQFDGILAQASLLHVPRKDIEATIQSLAKLLIPGGYFYISLKHKEGHALDEEIVKEDDYGYVYERFFSYYSQEEVETYLKNTGFRVAYTEVWKNKYGKSKWVQVIAQKL